MKKHYETHVEDTDKLVSVAGPILEYKSWYEQYRKLMEEQATDKNRIGDNTLYQKLIEIHSQGESIKSDIGDIGSVLDYINGEEV